MSNNVGLWIDHRHAVIVTITDSGESIRHVLSHMEKHIRYSGHKQDQGAEDQQDRRFTGHLSRYYDQVLTRIRDADAILILGPGEAKGELKTHLENALPGSRIAGCDAADKMTVGQIAAKVRVFFEQFQETAAQTSTSAHHYELLPKG